MRDSEKSDSEKSDEELLAEIAALRRIADGLEAPEHVPPRECAGAAAVEPIVLRLEPHRCSLRSPELAHVDWLTHPEASLCVRDAGGALPPLIDPDAKSALPWEPMDLSRLLDVPKGSLEPEERLSVVTNREKQNIRRVKDVPRDSVSTSGITSTMERPRSLDLSYLRRPWFDQLTTAFLLQLRDGFIGDNVIFDAERYYSFGKWWLGWQDDSWNLYAETREVRHVDAGISIAAWGGESFQHFIVDALPKLASVIDWLEDPRFAHVRIVSHNEGAEAAQWFWHELGLAERVVQKPLNAEAGFVIHADLALFAQFAPNLGHFGLHPRHCLRPVQQRLGVLDGADQDSVLYLRRTGHRSVANEGRLLSELDDLLAGTRYHLQIFESSSDLGRAMAVFKRAKLVLGPHGEAFANLVFAQPGTRVIEFNPIYRLYAQWEDPHALYWGLSQAAGLEYWSVAPRNFGALRERMVVDHDEVLQIVRNCLFEPA